MNSCGGVPNWIPVGFSILDIIVSVDCAGGGFLLSM